MGSLRGALAYSWLGRAYKGADLEYLFQPKVTHALLPRP